MSRSRSIMTRHSSVEISSTQPTETDVPLSERPLIAVDQNTVISPDLEAIPVVMPETPLTATAQEIRDRLFALPDVGGGEHAEQGVRMGHVEVESRIGSGGMGAVFKAVDLELSRTIALKVLHPTIAADPSLVARFRNESRACAQLGHDNIARVYSAGEYDGVHYIAYEYAEGRTLKQLVEEHGVLPAEETVNYAIQATLALNHMYGAGIIHRDIKPSNIILTTAGRIKVVDLGLARRETTDSIGDLTVAGTTLGTFDYIAPEQARDPRVADIRSDIYSLGCTVYHMLTGQPPYPEGTALQKLLDHQGKSPPDPRLISKDVPAEVAAVVQKMMNTDPEDRYQVPGQLLADLIDVASRMGLRSVPAEGVVWRRVPITRVRQLSGSLFMTGATIAICLTALAMQLFPDNTSNRSTDLDEFAQLVGLTPSADESPPGAGNSPTMGENVVILDGPEMVPAPVEETESPATAIIEGDGGEDADTQEVMSPPVPPFVVYHLDGDQFSAATLPVAWGEARNGDIIELNFNGALPMPTYRLGALSSSERRQVTIRAAEGYSPTLVFEGDMRTNRPTLPGQLFYLTPNLELVISGIDFQVNVKEDVQDDKWVLFECNGSNRIDMQDCTITIENRIRRETCVFRYNDQTSNIIAPNLTSVSLKNVTIRGGGDLVVLDDQVGGSFSAQNCGFALNGSLVQSRGSNAMVPQGDLLLTLDHTTSILSEPVIRMRDSEFLDGGDSERTLPKMEVISEACVYSSVLSAGTLIDIRGNSYREDLQDHLTWNGTNNLYNGYTKFLLVESGSLDGDARPIYFNDWVNTWERMSVASETSADLMADDVWKNHNPAPDRLSLSSLPIDVYALERSYFFESNAQPARHLPDGQGRIVGVDVSRLPAFPPTQPVSSDDAPSEATADTEPQRPAAASPPGTGS